jgi:hypothetical protein
MAEPALENAFSIEAAKGSSIAVLLLCSFSAASPLAAPAATVAVLGYLGSVLVDKLLTGRLCPIPMCRVSASDGLAIIGALQGGEIDEQAQHLLSPPENWADNYQSRKGMEPEPILLPEPRRRAIARPMPEQPPITVIPNKVEVIPEPLSEPLPLDDPWEDLTVGDLLARPSTEDIQLHRGLPAVVENQKCCVIYGNPGSGKGIQLSNSIRELKRINPEVHVFGIDPKADPKEDGYWAEGFDSLHRENISKMEPNQAAAWLYEKVSKFHMMSGPRLLVWDEAMTSMAAFVAAKGEKDYTEDGKWTGQWLYKPGSQMLDTINFWATGWVSSGDSRNIRAWFITQSGNLEDLPFKGGTKSQLRQIILARDTDEPLVTKMGENRTLNKGKADMDHVRRICSYSPVGRAIYVSDMGEWRPLAKLPNLSGWDRDNQQTVAA